MTAARKFGDLLRRHQLATFVIVALIIATAMTVVSLRIYVTSGAMKLDLSRPGYEQARQNITQNDDSEKPYPSTGALTPAATDDFRARLNKQQQDLQNLGDFGDDVLSDHNLGLE